MRDGFEVPGVSRAYFSFGNTLGSLDLHRLHCQADSHVDAVGG